MMWSWVGSKEEVLFHSVDALAGGGSGFRIEGCGVGEEDLLVAGDVV